MKRTSDSPERLGWKVLEFARRPPDIVASVVYVGAILIGFTVAVIAVVILARLISAAFSGSAEDINKLLLSLAGIIGGPFVIWRTIIAAQQVSVARESHYTSLFTKAIEQLGATREVKALDHSGAPTLHTEPNLEVRLGAIYALERIALDSERDHSPIMETLCAYVRQNVAAPAAEPEDVLPGTREYAVWVRSLPRPRADVLAVMKVLGRRPQTRIGTELKDLGSVERTPFDLTAVNLQRVRLKNLRLAHLDLTGSSLEGAYLMHVDFSDTELYGCSFAESIVSNCKFDNASAMTLNMRGAHLRRTTARAALLSDASFSEARLYDCDFANANLEGVKFVRSRVRGSDFRDTDLTAAELMGSSWSKCSVDNAKLEAAMFASVHDEGQRITDFSKVTGLNSEQIASAFGTKAVKLPPGVQMPPSWP
jgi:uncharacterized protein YjbI with pentapeptide repeats